MRAASISLCATAPSSACSRRTRALGNRQLAGQFGLLRPLVSPLDGTADRAQVGQDLALADFSAGSGMPLGPGSTLPAKVACTRPPVSGSAITWPLSSIVAESGAMTTRWLRTPICRCSGLGTNRLPSGRRCGDVAWRPFAVAPSPGVLAGAAAAALLSWL
jgi:hypothetical protein